MPNKYKTLKDAITAIPHARRTMSLGSKHKSPLQKEIYLLENCLGLDGFRIAKYFLSDAPPDVPPRPDLPLLHFCGFF